MGKGSVARPKVRGTNTQSGHVSIPSLLGTETRGLRAWDWPMRILRVSTRLANQQMDGAMFSVSSLLELIQGTTLGYRFALRVKHGARAPGSRPSIPWVNTALRRHEEVRASLELVKQLGLPPVPDKPKNWDCLAALDQILARENREARVFDAGGETYSMILPWLFLYGYKNLVAGNIAFQRPRKRGPIKYVYSDITRTSFPDESFDVVTCLSVIEHGVDLTAYFKEMSRILKPGGLLFTSTDYFETPIDAKGQIAYGVPIHIFSRSEIEAALGVAKQYGFKASSSIHLLTEEKVLHWSQYDLHYTFLNFCLIKAS